MATNAAEQKTAEAVKEQKVAEAKLANREKQLADLHRELEKSFEQQAAEMVRTYERTNERTMG